MKKTRFIWLGCIVGMHIAIGVTMGMYLFALVLIVLNLAAFGADSEFAERISRKIRQKFERSKQTQYRCLT